jgi:hypothetical protein
MCELLQQRKPTTTITITTESRDNEQRGSRCRQSPAQVFFLFFSFFFIYCSTNDYLQLATHMGTTTTTIASNHYNIRVLSLRFAFFFFYINSTNVYIQIDYFYGHHHPRQA